VGKKQISPILAPLGKFWRNLLLVLPEKIPPTPMAVWVCHISRKS